jgi:molecular chaperone GrpE
MTEEKNTSEEQEEVVPQEEEKTPEALADEYLNSWKRALADYDNLKKEMEVKSKEWKQMGMMQVLMGVIPVYNNFVSAVRHIPEDQKSVPWVTGVMYIKQNLEELFTELGLTMIPTVGSAFDDTLHEAVKEEESDQASGTILQQVSVGFKKGDDVIIPAKVVVAK